MLRVFRIFVFLLLVSCAFRAHAQQVQAAPGQFDFYLLNMSWSPEFCSTLNTLTPAEHAARGGDECGAPHGFVLHGLWPQNFDGSYPADCSSRPGPRDYSRYEEMTPDVSLLRHEWAKHGTCTTLSPDAFFGTARLAYTSVVVPAFFRNLNTQQMLPPATILNLFYAANPTFPQGSFALSCGGNRLTAIEACFSKDGVKPIACQNIRTCRANAVRIQPDASGGIVQ